MKTLFGIPRKTTELPLEGSGALGMKKLLILSAITAALTLGQHGLYGQATWVGVGNATTPAAWSTSSNWTGTAPTNGSTVTSMTFSNTANSWSNNDLTGLTVNGITFETTTPARDNIITGNKFTLAGDLTDATGSWQKIGTDIGITSKRSFAINSGQLTLTGNITDGSSAGEILKTGASWLYLTGTGSLSGVDTLVINAGTGAGTFSKTLVFNATGAGNVILQNTAALGAAGKVVEFNTGGGGTLDLQTDTSVNAYTFNVGSNGNTNNIIIANRLTAGAGITHNLGVLNMGSAAITINSGSNVTSGTAGVAFTALSMSAGNDNQPVIIYANAAVTIGSAGNTNNTGNNRRLQLDGASTGSSIGVISNMASGASGTGITSLIKAGSGTWALTAANTYNGTTTITGGTLQLGNGSTTGSLSTSSAITNNATLAFNRSNTVTQGTDFASTISGTGSFVKSGAGNLILSGANVSGGIAREVLTISNSSSGTVTLTNTAALGAAGNTVRFGSTSFQGVSGVLDLQTDTSVNAYNIASGNGNGGTITVNRATAGAGITHNLGTLDLSSVTINANTGSNVTSGTAGISFTSMTLSGGNDDHPVTLAGNATWTMGNATITNVAIAKRLQLDGTSAGNVVAGVISNGATAGMTLNLIKANTSTWTLNGTSTYNGTTTVNAGTLKAGSTQAFGSNSAVTLANTAGAILDLNSNSNSIGSLTGGGASGGNVTLGSATLTVGGDNTSPAAYAGVISGTSGALTKNGTGTLTLSNFNTFTGGTTVNGGNLTLSTVGGGTGVIRGTLSISSGATVVSNFHDSFGFNEGSQVKTINITGGTLSHTPNDTLTLASAVVNMTGGLMQATGGTSAGFDLYDNGSGNTVINTLASSSTATISGRLNLRAGDNDPVGTIFTVADGSAATDLLVSGIVADTAAQGVGSKIQKSGTGTMSLTGNNSYTGGTILNAGTLAINSNTSLGASTGNLTFAGNSTLRTDATISSSRNYAINSGVTATIDTNGNALTNNGTISGQGGLAKVGTGILTLSGANTYNGPTSVNSGATLALGINNAIPSGSAVTLGDTTTTGTLNMGTYTDVIASLAFGAANGTLKMAANQTGSAQLTASGTAALGTTNTLDLTGMSTSAGVYKLVSGSSLTGTFTTVTGMDSAYTLKYGVLTPNELDVQHKATISLALGSNAASVHVGSQTVNLSVGNTAPTSSAGLNYTLGGVSGSGTRAAQATSVGTGTYTATAGVNSFSITANDGNATNSGSVAFSQTGYNLAAANATQTVNVGNMHVGGTKTASVTLENTAAANATYTETLASNGFSGTSANFSAAGSVTGIAGGSSGSGTLVVGLGSGLSAGAVSGTTTLALNSSEVNGSGLGTTVLSAQTITITGQVYSGQGVWNTNGSGSYGTLANMSNWTTLGGAPGLDSGFASSDTATFGSALTGGTATVNLNGAAPSLAGVTFSNAAGSYILSNGSVTLNNGGSAATLTNTSGSHTISADVILASNLAASVSANASLEVTGVISGSNKALDKTGAGTLTLSGNNTYSGATTVTDGKFVVDGSLASLSLTVGANATLGGTGAIAGDTTINGTHSPGNSPGIQNFTGNLTYNVGSSVNWELSANTTTNAANPNAIFDTVVVAKNLSFGGRTELNLSFNPVGGNVIWSDPFWQTSKTGTNGWLVYDVAGSTFNFSNLNLVVANWEDSGGSFFNAVLGNSTFSLYQGGSSIFLNYKTSTVTTPEPTSGVAMAVVTVLGGTSFLLRRRSRQASGIL